MRKQNCGTSSNTVLIFLVRKYETSSEFFFFFAEAELRSQYIPVAEAELQVTQHFPYVEAELLIDR